MNTVFRSLLCSMLFLVHSQTVFAALEDVFSNIYNKAVWGDNEGETLCGGGSTLYQTQIMRSKLPRVLQQLGIKTLLDAGCGDFNWLKVTNLGVEDYIGVDVVPFVIEKNKQLYENEHRRFLHLNIVEDPLPQADLILCRDVFRHLSFKDIKQALTNFKKTGARYMIITMQIKTKHNREITSGDSRNINFRLHPFHFPKPLILIKEGAYEGPECKTLAVWALDDIHPELIQA